jgi:hypothetical protein
MRTPVLATLLLLSCAPAAQPLGEPKGIAMQPIGRLANGQQSTVIGTARITTFNNGRTTIDVQLNNQPPNSRRSGAVFRGTCTNRASTPTLLLSDISANATGFGQVKTDLETAKIPVPGYIVYYQRARDEQGGIGDPITCGDLR